MVFNTHYLSIAEILDEINDSTLKRLFSKETGIVNFYKAFRNTAFKWAKNNQKAILKIYKLSLKIQNDYDIIQLAKFIEDLPPIPKANHKSIKMSCESLLTPLLACIDKTKRFPIINKNSAVVELHKLMGISSLSLSEKAHDLLELMTENKIKDSLFLDVYNKKAVKQKITKIRKENKKISKELLPKDDADIKYILTEKRRIVVRNHRRLEKRLILYCKKRNIRIEEGLYSKLKYDALLKNYKNHRDLLIEIKGSNKIVEIRLALGQILDYGFDFKNKKTDLAIFFPQKPTAKYIKLARELNINVLWLKGNNIFGTIKI